MKPETLPPSHLTMPRPQKKPIKASAPRDYDAESGKNRVSRPRKPELSKALETESEPEISLSESEVEQELALESKDIARRKKQPVRKPRARAQQDNALEDTGTEPAPSRTASTSIAPSMAMLLAINYRLGLSTISQPARSYYIPDVHALFTATHAMCDIITLNGKLHEVYPAFLSSSFSLYVGHLYYYHILRCRNAAGELSLTERRCLRRYETIGHPEAWPVPTPLISILSSYGIVTPRLSTTVRLSPNCRPLAPYPDRLALANLYQVQGIARIPIIPALQKFLFNISREDNLAINDVLHPVANATLTPGAVGAEPRPPNIFCGISLSAADAQTFQTLVFSSAWKQPTETGMDLPNAPFALKRIIARRLNIPDVTNNMVFNNLESFLGF